MAHGEVVIRFEKVSFEYGHNKPILEEVDFSIRRGMKVTIMGQNGAGKSTLFSLITGASEPEDGNIHRAQRTTIALSRQVIPRDELDLTVRAFFEKCFTQKVYDIDPRIDAVLEVVNLKGHEKVHDRIISSFSGGQQARLLLASALIQEPDILLLDEPTNNLDKAGIAHLTDFLVKYKKTVIVISHDAHFLNSFTDAVLYLDVYTRKIEQYVGNYTDVRDQIAARMERENRKNALLSKEIQAKKDQANAFAMKGGNLRAVAKRMRDLAEELEEEKVDVRKEDRTIRPFTIPFQEEQIGDIVTLTSLSILKNNKPKDIKVGIKLRKNKHLLLAGPNGIGKSTLLEALAQGKAKGATIAPDVRVGYYRQDFSTLNFNHTVFESLAHTLEEVTGRVNEETIRATVAGFLITGDMVHTKIGSLSEGQKGLVAFAQLVLTRPGLLILDEPTNHINFRHLPVIAKALDEYKGAMILVSHVPEFVSQIRIDEILDLGEK
ncbi:MAG: ABC-F family ATP-binding cassette domain-containing protein [Candidatus Pacebacteria bacterium]|jgi:ATPase subunit of ABC transporter with duplicated ATPase domains|nr:ABC-F family ATP-binding cassette domain-containing protein [Candidatus Paceibacterota bacterium]